MTDANKKAAVAQELRHAGAALDAARLLRQAGLFNDALSRLYYALFHTLTALLLTAGVEARRHRALPSLLGMHFVANGPLTSTDVAMVGRTALCGAAFTEVVPPIERVRAHITTLGY